MPEPPSTVTVRPAAGDTPDEQVRGAVAEAATPAGAPFFDRATLYGAMIGSATDYAIMAADLDGRIIEWNVGAEAVLGWPAAEIIGQHLSVIFTPEDQAAGVPGAEMQRALLSGRALDERWHMRRDGSRFWADGRMMPLASEPGVFGGYLKIVRDETGRKLSASEAVSATALKVITDHVDTAILQVDADGAVIFSNPAASRLLGWSAAELNGRAVEGILTLDPPADGRAPFADRVATALTIAGNRLPVLCSRNPIVVADAPIGAVLTMQDDSRRRQTDEAMRAELRRHEALAEIQRATDHSGADLDAVYRIVVDAAVDIIAHAGSAAIELVDGDHTVNHVTTDAALGEVGMRVARAGSLAGAALALGQAVICHDTQTDNRVDRGRSLRYGVRSMIVVPIPHAGRHVGVLKVSATRPDAFAPRDLLVAHVLAGHIATAYARSDEATALQRLQRSEQRLQLALEVSDTIGIWDWDIRNDRCYGDARFARLLGVEPDEAADGLPIARYTTHVHPEDLVWIKVAARRAMAEAGEFALEFRAAGSGEAPTWMSAHGRSFNGADGAPLRFLGAVVDVTERKRIETSLRDAETNARLAVEAAGLGLWHYDPVKDTLRCDDRCRDIVGFPRDEEPTIDAVLTSIHPRSRARIADVARKALAAATLSDRAHEFEIVRRDDGTERWVEVSAQAFFQDRLLTRIIGTVGDITEKMRAREAQARFGESLERQVAMRTEELIQANTRLLAEMADRQRVEDALRQSQKMEAVGQLTGGIAHDFNNLLTGITGSLDLMRKRIEQGRSADVERYMTAAATSAHRAAALTHRLLAFARRQPLDSKPVRLNLLAASLDDLFRRTLGESIDIVFDLYPDLWTTLCDPHQLENALLNLVINARDAMPDGGQVTIRTANVTIGPDDLRTAPDRREGDFVVLKVSDTGVGMAPNVLARVFEPFFTTKPIGQGTGLGLSMIYGFARQSEGYVSVASHVGEGTVFTLLLPRFKGHDEERLDDERAVPGAAQGETVLVVEDDAVVRALVLDVLSDLGYHTLEAHDGLAGLALLQGRARIDLLVTDVGLPGLNGRQLAEMGRASRPGLKVLFITGYAENAVFGGAAEDPATRLITKPFAIDALAARISEMIATSR